MKTTKKGFVIPLVLAIIAVGVLAGSVFYYQKSKTSSKKEVTNTTDIKTYTNTRFGFSFNYPATAILNDSPYNSSGTAAVFRIQLDKDAHDSNILNDVEVTVYTNEVAQSFGWTKSQDAEYARIVVGKTYTVQIIGNPNQKNIFDAVTSSFTFTSSSLQTTLSDAQIIAALGKTYGVTFQKNKNGYYEGRFSTNYVSGVTVGIFALGDLNNDGYQDAFVQTVVCGASCGSEYTVVVNTNNNIYAVKVVPHNLITSGAAQVGVKNIAINQGVISMTVTTANFDGSINADQVYQYIFSGNDLISLDGSTNSTSETNQDYFYDELVRTNTNIFWCRYLQGTESGCALFVSDITGGNKKYLNVTADVGENVVASPKGKYILVVFENKAMVIDTATLTQKTVIEVPKYERLGTYTGFPNFEARAYWIDANDIWFSIYDTNNSYIDATPVPKPLRVQVVALDGNDTQSITLYDDPAGVFSFLYPSSFNFVNEPDVYGSELLVEPVKKFVMKLRTTEYGIGKVSLFTSQNPIDVANCTVARASTEDHLINFNTSINGIDFLTLKTEDYAAGQYADWTEYHVVRNGICYVLTGSLQGLNTNRYTGSEKYKVMNEYNYIRKSLQSVIETFTFTQ